MNVNDNIMGSLGKLVAVEEVSNVFIENPTSLYGSNGARLGVMGMLHNMLGAGDFDGYKITTSVYSFFVLIDNNQNCCESWGYFSSEDDFNEYIGKELREVVLTDTALNQKSVDLVNKTYFDAGGIQFVNFNFADNSVLQFAVYNAHNGYYGHSIFVIKDDEIMHSDTL